MAYPIPNSLEDLPHLLYSLQLSGGSAGEDANPIREFNQTWRVRELTSSGHYQFGHADTGAFEIDPYKETGSERQTSQGSYFDNPELAYACECTRSFVGTQTQLV
jgi:hypothetical protein